jgi:hypothetical protein
VKLRLLFFGLVTPLGVIGRPFWRRRLSKPSGGDTYWHSRGDTVTADDLRRAR